MLVSCLLCCVDSGLCDELITRSQESYRVCDLESSKTRQPRPHLSCSVTGGKIVINEDELRKHADRVNIQINLRYPYTNNDNN